MTRGACLIVMLSLCCVTDLSAASGNTSGAVFPPSLESYADGHLGSIAEILLHRIEVEPFNLAATIIFLCAIIHTFLTSRLMEISHRWEHEHAERVAKGERAKGSAHFGAGVFHFLGEVEAVFGIWAVVLVGAIIGFYDWNTTILYLTNVNYTEPMFVGVIMILAATRPMLKAAELLMWKVANLFGGMLAAWWLTILTLGPILGSFITEPAAMTISALLLGEKFYALAPSNRFKYATLGLLFVNISVGGTLTHFAAPPVLMVAGPWDWGLMHMLTSFGWKAVIGIVVANAIYFLHFRGEMDQLQGKYAVVRMKRELQSRFVRLDDLQREFEALEESVGEQLGFTASFHAKCDEIKTQLHAQILAKVDGLEEQVRHHVDRALLDEAFEQRFEEIRMATMRKSLPGLLPTDQRPRYRDPNWDQREDFVPGWMIFIHILFMAWTVFNAHHPALFIGGFLFYLGFAQATAPYQNRLDLKPPLLVGFFLAGLVMHGGVQGWWIAPVLGSLGELPLLVGATVLTAFNDNAAITYLSTLVPGFTDSLKYAVVAGAVTGGGLTVIANAPNPAGQSILRRYFPNGISPAGLLAGALLPTVVMGLCFLLLRF
ncbi:MAG: putative Na+/H+ antiporter [Candidatus Latescibacterota bacterium]|nr:putative Na+/H+ antiporter [Candidatus Latescibacterota bacterium]